MRLLGIEKYIVINCEMGELGFVYVKYIDELNKNVEYIQIFPSGLPN
jgi:hypothetical protein